MVFEFNNLLYFLIHIGYLAGVKSDLVNTFEKFFDCNLNEVFNGTSFTFPLSMNNQVYQTCTCKDAIITTITIVLTITTTKLHLNLVLNICYIVIVLNISNISFKLEVETKDKNWKRNGIDAKWMRFVNNLIVIAIKNCDKKN